MNQLFKNLSKIEKFLIIAIIIASVIGGVMLGVITSQIKNFSGIQNLKEFQPSVPTKLYDINGELIAELFLEKRELISHEDLPQSLINAFLATEDRNFYNHFGISMPAIFRAMIKNIQAGRIVQGGSTITQQLAKRLFTSGERTYARKALEAILALQIEKKFSKNEILEMYFNQIYLGHGCYGISSAARLFFNKKVKHLSLAESSVLAAIPSAPTRYSPLMNTRNAYIRNKETLSGMVDAGYISQEKADKLYREFWPRFIDSIKTEYTTKTAFSKTVDQAPYFTDYVRQILVSRFGKERVYNEGLNVYTTLDLNRQEIAQKHFYNALKRQNRLSKHANTYTMGRASRNLFNTYNILRMVFNLPRVVIRDDIEANFKRKFLDGLVDSADVLSLFVGDSDVNDAMEKFRIAAYGISTTLKVEGAIVAVEPQTGFITTMIGGSGFTVDNQFNRAIQAYRQPGSSFKPFVYGAGIEADMVSPATMMPDAPIIDIDVSGEIWAPGNYEGEFTGMVNLKKALAASINIISVRVYDIVGADNVINFASRMLKIPEYRFTPGPALALGSTEVTPLEMVTGYAIYANRGRDVIPFSIRFITDRDGITVANIEEEVGSIIAAKERNNTIQVIPETTAFTMTLMMQGVVDRGTATDAIRNVAGFRKICVGKTGTTQNWTDAWFCGFTSDIAAVVWVGYDRAYMSLGAHQAGAKAAAPIWGRYMRDIYTTMRNPKFPPEPPGIDHSKVYVGFVETPMKSVLDLYLEKEGLKKEEKKSVLDSKFKKGNQKVEQK